MLDYVFRLMGMMIVKNCWEENTDGARLWRSKGKTRQGVLEGGVQRDPGGVRKQAEDTVDQPLQNVELEVWDLAMENGTAGGKLKPRPRRLQGNRQGSQVESSSTCQGIRGSVLSWPEVRTQLEKTARGPDQGGSGRSGTVAVHWTKGIRDAARSFSAHGARLEG